MPCRVIGRKGSFRTVIQQIPVVIRGVMGGHRNCPLVEQGQHQISHSYQSMAPSASKSSRLAGAETQPALTETTDRLLTAIRQGTVARQTIHDEKTALRWIEETLHPQGLCCPRCGSKYRRIARHKGKIPAWRCTDCDRYYTMISGTIFEKTRQSADGLLQIIHGIYQGRPLTHLANEMDMSRKQVYNIREKLTKFNERRA